MVPSYFQAYDNGMKTGSKALLLVLNLNVMTDLGVKQVATFLS